MSVKPNLPGNKAPKYTGQIGKDQKFAKPFEAVDSGIGGLNGTHEDIGEKSGFQAETSAYIVKKGTAYGEAAKFNAMPAGMDINDQPHRDIRDMPLQLYSGGESYPSDGWSPEPRNVPEGYASKGSAN